jgi:exonuclease SbcC
MLEQIQAMKTEFQHWNVLQTAFGDATGDRFSKIAQQYTLDLLIQIANKKLSEFKARYILQQEKHPKGDSHLVVVDQYLGNQIRSVDTLSGGEMFLTSLALAMALSEFASQNAQLNTLFIDEGFGTLDPDSLNAAMEAIDTIRHQSKKMIGLISHVQELRERIHCQIEVKPKGNGQSAIEIRTQST